MPFISCKLFGVLSFNIAMFCYGLLKWSVDHSTTVIATTECLSFPAACRLYIDNCSQQHVIIIIRGSFCMHFNCYVCVCPYIQISF